MLQALRRVLNTSMDYLINGTETSELNADPLISEAIQELRKLKTEKSRKAVILNATENIKLKYGITAMILKMPQGIQSMSGHLICPNI